MTGSRGNGYDQVAYWSTRFEREDTFEWLITSERFMQVLRQHIPADPELSILQLGAGTSDLHLHLRALDVSVTNVDFEPLALERGKVLEHNAYGNLKTMYLAEDVLDLSSTLAGMFDVVVDKSTADAVSCGGNDAVQSMMWSVRQTMKKNAVWICCSYSETRFSGFKQTWFKVSVIDKILSPKRCDHDPDIYTWIYMLQPTSMLE